jgi:hypothetical protein
MARMGANGKPMPEKKQETLQEILEVNPNVVDEEILSDEPEMEEDDENEEL